MYRRVAPHGFEMELRFDDWMERAAALTGVFYEIEVIELLRKLLRAGDVFVDVGANVGFVTLNAVRLIGPEGRALAVEPNPDLVERLRMMIARNGIKNVAVVSCALGDSAGEACLACHGHHGAASLRHGAADGLAVRVIPGDDLTSDIAESAWCVVKIDVEGYEQRVLRGMTETLRRPRTAFLVEITDDWL